MELATRLLPLRPNFAEIDRGVVTGPGTALSWSIDHAGRSMARSRTAGRLLRLALFWVRYLDRFSSASFGTDGACALFFLGRRSETTLSPRAIVAEYAGGQRLTRRQGERRRNADLGVGGEEAIDHRSSR